MTAPMERKIQDLTHVIRTMTNSLNQITKALDKNTEQVRKLNMTLQNMKDDDVNIPSVPQFQTNRRSLGPEEIREAARRELANNEGASNE